MTPYAIENRRRRARAEANTIMLLRVVAIVLTLLGAAALGMLLRTGSGGWMFLAYVCHAPAFVLLTFLGIRTRKAQ